MEALYSSVFGEYEVNMTVEFEGLAVSIHESGGSCITAVALRSTLVRVSISSCGDETGCMEDTTQAFPNA
jgi:hypothetical protein